MEIETPPPEGVHAPRAAAEMKQSELPSARLKHSFVHGP
jgi:hypothetical protein